MEKRLDAYAAKNQYVKRLRSVPGIGLRLSEIVVAVIDDPKRFKNGRQVAAYAGLVPRVFQSGSVDRKGRITGAGNRYLRSILVEVSWLGLRINPWMKQAGPAHIKNPRKQGLQEAPHQEIAVPHPVCYRKP